MNTNEIYQLASELTEQQILNVIGGWEHRDDTKKIEDFSSLVRLGDSRALAMATIMIGDCEANDSPLYKIAYES